MGFNFADDLPNEENIDPNILSDFQSQVDFHKSKFLNEEIEVVGEVLELALIQLVKELPVEDTTAITPMLSAMCESIIELRGTTDVLRTELLEKNVQPPDDFQFN